MNCGYGRGFSVLEVLDAVDRVTNLKLDRRLEPRRPGDTDALVADNGRLLGTLPWRPRRADLDIIVPDPLAWERRLAERARGPSWAAHYSRHRRPVGEQGVGTRVYRVGRHN